MSSERSSVPFSFIHVRLQVVGFAHPPLHNRIASIVNLLHCLLNYLLAGLRGALAPLR